jgi:hypothetical protein
MFTKEIAKTTGQLALRAAKLTAISLVAAIGCFIAVPLLATTKWGIIPFAIGLIALIMASDVPEIALFRSH